MDTVAPHLGAKGVKREIAEQSGMVKRLVRPGDYQSAFVGRSMPIQYSGVVFPHFQFVSAESHAKDTVKREEGTASALRVKVKIEHPEDWGNPRRTIILSLGP
eukprot:11662878-Heterocapsa_arctica.AAC.1